MHKIYLYLALALLSCFSLRAAELTVVIAVDGLDAASLQEMQPYWPQGGLRTLSEEAYQTTVAYPHWLYGGNEALATLLTGTTPSQHGVCGNYAFSRDTRQPYNIFQSSRKLGIGTHEGYTCDALLTPTVTDRLRLSGNETARIYAIGIDATTAVMLAGHAANGCCWLQQQPKSQEVRWASTSYYREGLPSAADRMNMDGSLAQIMSHEWNPIMEITTYNHPTAEERKRGFAYASAPLLPTNVNTAVVELALALQKDQKLGQRTDQDVLLLQLTAISPKAKQAAVLSAEQEDLYLRLNQDIGYLMEQLSRRVGKDHLRLVVVGTPRLGLSTTQMENWNMPVGTFSLDRAVALTSTYLMALYGHERWVDGGLGQTIYLNRTLIEQKHLSLETIRRQVAEFLMEFDGVTYACTASEAYTHPDMRSSLHKRFVGDVVFQLQPNYTLSESPLLPVTYYLSPVMIWSGARTPFPPSLHNATEVANYIFQTQ